MLVFLCSCLSLFFSHHPTNHSFRRWLGGGLCLPLPLGKSELLKNMPRVHEPALEIKGFPEALESVVEIMSLAQRDLVFTCYTIDHSRVLSLVQEKLRAGVRGSES